MSQNVSSPAALIKGKDCFYIFEDVNVIGRSQDSFVLIQGALISRKHCIIEKSNDNIFTIRDVSATGTFINGKKLVKNEVYQLHHHDKICLANLEQYTYTFILNKKFEDLKFRMKEKMLNFDNSHSDKMKELNTKLSEMETEKSDLKEEMNNRLEVQETIFKNERLSLSSLLMASNEQKLEIEQKLRVMEKKSKFEKDKLKEEIENKIAVITKKEQELQQVKNEMELHYENERKELEDRCKAEIDELKGKLAEFEVEQGLLQGKTRQVEQQLEETKKILLECEIEQSRLCDQEFKLESKINDLTKEITSKDVVVKHLEEKLREKEKAEEKRKKEIEVLEEELQCSICAELFIEPTVLNCGHMFCKSCIEEWKHKKKICPMCRSKINTSVRIFTVDTIIEKDVALLSNEARSRREALILRRQEVKCQVPAKKRKHNRTNAQYQVMTAQAGDRVHIQSPEVQMVVLRHSPEQVNLVPQVVHSTPTLRVQLNALEQRTVPDITTDNEPDDPFTWTTGGLRQGMRTRTAAARVEQLQEQWVAPLARPVTVAAIDLTNVNAFSEQRNINAPSTSREPIDLTNLPQELIRVNESAVSLNGTIDLTTP